MTRIKRVHVNQHILKANKKNATNDPAFTVKCGGKTYTAHKVSSTGYWELGMHLNDPLSCGATTWIETTASLVLHTNNGTAEGLQQVLS